MSDRKVRKFEVEVLRRYYSCHTIEIESDSEMGLEERAKEIAAQEVADGAEILLEDVEVDIYSEEVIDD